jgi:hypothetical protein
MLLYNLNLKVSCDEEFEQIEIVSWTGVHLAELLLKGLHGLFHFYLCPTNIN